MNDGVMVALALPLEVCTTLSEAFAEADQYAFAYSRDAGGGYVKGTVAVPPEEMHLTLAFLGKVEEFDGDPGARERLTARLESLASHWRPIKGAINGYARLVGVEPEKGDPFVALIDIPELPEFRASVLTAIDSVGLMWSMKHGFLPHCTLAHTPTGAMMPELPGLPLPLVCSTLILGWDGDWQEFPLQPRSAELRAAVRFAAARAHAEVV